MGFPKFSMFSSLCFIILLLKVSGENDDQPLLMFKSGIVSDRENALANWSLASGIPVCKWTGIKCNNVTNRVVQLDLSGFSLHGTISPAIGDLSSLLVLDLSKNFFTGQIPREIGFLINLKQLSLSWNVLSGNIPVQLGSLRHLMYLDLESNNLEGDIPSGIFCNGSSSLEYIDFSNNTLTGEIPLKNECALQKLRFLLLWSNKLVGPIPDALSKSTRLEWLDLESNSLTGELPASIISKMPRLQFLYLSYNEFTSTNLQPFFASLMNSSNFQELELAGNNLSGEIPSIIGNLTNVLEIHLDGNRIYGSIPPQLSNLPNLTLLNLSSNLLNGTIPFEICGMQKLERVYLSNNSLSGEVPSAFGNMLHLGLLDLSKNKLSGSIPDSFSNLSQLRKLLLYENQLSGTIPPSLGKCLNLEILDLSRNRLSGVIPNEVAALRSLKLYLNLSRNHLHGEIPLEISKMDMVLAIDLSCNNFSGTIPPQLGSCIALEYLNLSNNSLEGDLPDTIGQLPYLKDLDVSSNSLVGVIPASLPASSTLKVLNLSFNMFSGNVSNKGAFSSMNIDSFLGNKGLCGSIKGLPACKKIHVHYSVLLPILLFFVGTPVLCIFGYPLVRMSKKLSFFNGEQSGDEEKEPNFRRISYQQLVEATGGFTSSSLIGSGRFGHVYKGVLPDNTRIAVKVLDSQTSEESSGSFKRECQILKRTRHRNLIKILTTCCGPEFKALVLPLMSNGSLERHLYLGQGVIKYALDLVQFVSICSDVAEGVAYLHHYSHIRVVHCDLKPSNILLDDDMTALVADFGISRLVEGIDESVSSNDSLSVSSTDGLLCGSLGYIAPEYGMGKRPSVEGDVYSFGILLLEIVTGRRPIDFQEGSSLHEWVKTHYPHKLEPIVEQALIRCGGPPAAAESKPNADCYVDDKIWRGVILEMIELGLMCTQYNPLTRPSMVDVANEMGRLKQYLSNPSSVQLNIEEVTFNTSI